MVRDVCFPRPVGAWALLAVLFAVMTPPHGTARGDPDPSRPNFLFLLADDQRADTIAALGNRDIHTPNLDRLVREGTTLTGACSPHPVCVPSRAEMLTGCVGFRAGVPYGRDLTPGLALWPETLRRAGYRTRFVGKWHTPGTPHSRGFDETDAWYGGGPRPADPGVDHAGRPVTGYVGWRLLTDAGLPQQGSPVGLTPEISARFADAAIRLLRRPSDRPTFLQVSFTAPHDPLLVPPGWEHRYPSGSVPLPANFMPQHPFDHGNRDGRDELLFAEPRTPRETRREIEAYYAVISHLDEQVGRVLEALRTAGLERNTVVIYAADHGLAIGSHGLRGKQNMYEHTLRVPLILWGPGIPRDRRRDGLCALRDLFPTTCELAGVPLPDTVQGRSLLPLIRKGEQVHPELLGYYADRQRALLTERWKLIQYPRIRREQLFDLKSDPHELRDLSAVPKRRALLERLRARLLARQQAAGDPLAGMP